MPPVPTPGVMRRLRLWYPGSAGYGTRLRTLNRLIGRAPLLDADEIRRLARILALAFPPR
jgi:hypothetical protein